MSSLTPRVISTAHATVTDQIRRAIISGELEAGSRVVQNDLATQMGVSITPVREALRELSSEGLIELDAFKSTIVHRPSAAELSTIYDMRRALVPIAVERGVRNISDEELSAARSLCDQMLAEADLTTWLGFNREFHSILDGACNSTQLSSTLSRLAAISALYVNISLPQRRDQRDGANREHRELLDAYFARDAVQATRLSLDHLRATLDAALETFK